ncbi:ABC transporter ATP-binding protein [Maricaulis sp.]|uniref:ABC transporter ATP-binding protein n=1 Tax=Maricaulis sp. TaxID=1486257 RepID=UPI002626B39F|nr:ABC transporter ATP-binding protein [Maricaulis sp.]
MSEPVLQLQSVERTYVTEAGPLEVLRGIDLSLAPGEIVGLVGPSGSGKSSLLHAAGLLERPDGGDVLIDGVATNALNDAERTALRRNAIGFVYQFHHLLPEFDALENVVLPQQIAGRSQTEARERARALLTRLGLAERLQHNPAQLSGGEQQRVAIARALANTPRVLLADEPTGNLDPDTSATVFEAFRSSVRDAGAAALVATHNHQLAEGMDRIVTFDQGRLTALD